jgi:Lysophospholipase catalytic domain
MFHRYRMTNTIVGTQFVPERHFGGIFYIINLLLLIVMTTNCHLSNATTTTTTTTTGSELRLASSGGGLRAMVTNLGFYNAFQQAGIINVQNQTTLLTAISSVSGSSWLVGQVSYSQPFFDMAITNNPESVYQFTLDWLSSFQNSIIRIESNKKLKIRSCNLLSPFGGDSFCKILVYFDFQWGKYISNMFQSTVKLHGDKGLVKRYLTPENRITIFKNTDLMFQSSIAPMSKVNNRFKRIQKKILTYVGPNHKNNSVFSTVIGCQYTVVSGQNASVRFALESSMTPLKVYTGRAPRRFNFDDWKQYGYFGDERKHSIFTKLPSTCTQCTGTIMKNPFRTNGIGSFDQVISSSSAFLSDFTTAVPSFFSQQNSKSRYKIIKSSISWIRKQFKIRTLEAQLSILYKRTNFINDLSYCSSWPRKCSKGDVQIIDGGYTDVASK